MISYLASNSPFSIKTSRVKKYENLEFKLKEYHRVHNMHLVISK
jgi:hypothetical protein